MNQVRWCLLITHLFHINVLRWSCARFLAWLHFTTINILGAKDVVTTLKFSWKCVKTPPMRFTLLTFSYALVRYHVHPWGLIIAFERSEAPHYSWRAVVFSEPIRPSLSRDQYIVEISIRFQDVCCSSRASIPSPGTTFQVRGNSTRNLSMCRCAEV